MRVFSLVVVLTINLSLHAELLQFQYSGTIDSVEPETLFGGSIVRGAPFVSSVFVDDVTSEFPLETLVTYDLEQFRIGMPGFDYVQNGGQLRITNDDNSTNADAVTVIAFESEFSIEQVAYDVLFVLSLRDSSATSINMLDVREIKSLDLEEFDTRAFTFSGCFADFIKCDPLPLQIEGTIDSFTFVPESTFSLWAFLFTALLARRTNFTRIGDHDIDIRAA